MRKFLLVLLIILVSAGPVFCGEIEDTFSGSEKDEVFVRTR
jgi:hypothetical protein